MQSIDVLGGSWVVDHPGQNDVPEGSVGLAITAAAEAVPLVLPAAGIEPVRRPQRWAKAALVAQASGIVAGRDEEGRRRAGPDAGEGGDKFGGGLFDQGLEDGVDV